MNKVNQLYMAVKQAGLTGDIAGSAITAGFAPFGIVHGFDTDDIEVPNDAAGVIPGVGASRLVRRMRKVRKDVAPEAESQSSRILSDAFGPITSSLAAGAGGAGLGAGIGALRGNTLGGAVTGGVTAFGAGVTANLAGALAAALTKRRTRDEQRAAELEPGFLSHAAPGRGIYNYWKRLGYSKNYDEDAVKAPAVVGPAIEKARKLLEEMRNKG